MQNTTSLDLPGRCRAQKSHVCASSFRVTFLRDQKCGLSRSNLPPEVKSPGGKLLRSKLSPGHFTSKQTVRPGHFTSKESDPLRSRLSPLQWDILLRSRVSRGQFTSECPGTTYFEVECPPENLQ